MFIGTAGVSYGLSTYVQEPMAISRRAKPSQAKVLTGDGDLREVQVESPSPPFLRLTALPGSITETVTPTGEYAYANDFEVRVKALTDLAKE